METYWGITYKNWASIIFGIICLIFASPSLYRQFIKEPRQIPEVRQRGRQIKSVWNHINQGSGFRSGDVLAIYNFTIHGKIFDVVVRSSQTPRKFGLPDTLDAFYLDEAPSINRPAFVVFPEYKYNRDSEDLHRPRPVFDSIQRKYNVASKSNY